MNKFNEQVEVLDKICRIMYLSAPSVYDSLWCRFDYHQSSDGSISVGSEFSYITHGIQTSEALVYPERTELTELIPELHELMKNQTGGDWRSMIIMIDSDGKAQTKFEYN